MRTAILIDGGFFLKRFPVCYPNRDRNNAQEVARTAFELALSHLSERIGEDVVRHSLYRIFFYDCPPLLKKAQLPKSRGSIDFSKSQQARFRLELHDELRRRRKVALRLGHLSEHAEWRLTDGTLKSLLSGAVRFEDLTDKEFAYDARQKGVDMRVGIDIASLAFKKQVDQIILVAGDADFVAAAKLARREGIDFILDPLWNTIHSSLNEHVDGVRSTCPNPNRTMRPATAAAQVR